MPSRMDAWQGQTAHVARTAAVNKLDTLSCKCTHACIQMLAEQACWLCPAVRYEAWCVSGFEQQRHGSLAAELAASSRSLSAYRLSHAPGTREAQNMTGVMSGAGVGGNRKRERGLKRPLGHNGQRKA